MSLLDKLIPFGGVIEKVIERVFPDPGERAQAQLEIAKMAQAGEFRIYDGLDRSDAGQVQINSIEAASDSIFKSGWRPAAGWVCVTALAAQFFGVPLLTWVATNTLHWGPPPALETDQLVTLLCGMLGLGAFRTYEKVKR